MKNESMDNELNLNEAKETKKGKGIKNLVICAGAAAVFFGTATGVALYENTFDHTEGVCALTHILGVEHQMSKISESGYFPIYDSSSEFVVSSMVGAKEEAYTGYKDVPVYENVQVQIGTKEVPDHGLVPVYETKRVQVGTEKKKYTAYKTVPVYKDETVTYSADDTEIVLVDMENYRNTKTLKLK